MALSDKLRGFLSEIQEEKSAAAKKKAGAYTEAGSVGGQTTHPVKDVDDGTRKATEGARSAENTADVKEQEMAGNVDSAADKGPDQESVQFNVGVTSTETGKDPANEENYKSDKDDPGTSHPAKTDDGEKYGSWTFKQLKDRFEKNANDIMASMVAAGQPAPRPAAPAQPTKAATAPAPDKNIAAATAEKAAALKAAQAGYDLAAKAGQEKAAAAEKAAAEKAVEQTIRTGLAMATMTGNYLRAYEKKALTKAAEDEGGESEGGGEKKEKKESGGDKKEKKPGGESGGDSSGGDPSGGGAGVPGADAGLLGSMAGGGGGGGDPMAGGGGGGGDQTDAIQQILMALMEMGITPDQIMAQLQGGGGGAGGGMPPAGGDPMAGLGGAGGPPPGGDPMAGGGAPPMDPAAMGGDPTKMAAAKQAQKKRQDLLQLMKTAKAYQRSGKFRISEAKTAAEQRLRGEIKKCIAEIVG